MNWGKLFCIKLLDFKVIFNGLTQNTFLVPNIQTFPGEDPQTPLSFPNPSVTIPPPHQTVPRFASGVSSN